MDMEHYHCGHCGKYVDPNEGYHGAAERDDGGCQRIYCSFSCCVAEEPDIVEKI